VVGAGPALVRRPPRPRLAPAHARRVAGDPGRRRPHRGLLATSLTTSQTCLPSLRSREKPCRSKSASVALFRNDDDVFRPETSSGMLSTRPRPSRPISSSAPPNAAEATPCLRYLESTKKHVIRQLGGSPASAT